MDADLPLGSSFKVAGAFASGDVAVLGARRASPVVRDIPSIGFLLLLMGATGLAVLPVLAARHLPLLDGPAHVARLAVLRHILIEGGASPFYHLTSFFLPNVAFDVIGMALLPFTDPETAGRIFFAACQLLTLWGVVAFSRVAIGRWSILPLAATLLLYNLISTLGFLSYMFGVALVPWALAGRLALERRPLWRLVFGVVAGVVLLFCHMAALGLYATMICGVGLATAIRDRRLSLRAVSPLLETLPALVLLKLMPSGGMHELHYESPLVMGKAISLAKAITCGSMVGDAACILGIVMLGVLVVVAGRSRIRLDLLPGLAGIAALFVLLPLDIPPAGYIDIRLPAMLGLLGLASIDMRIRWRTPALVLAAVVALAVVAKQAAVVSLWRSDDVVEQAASDALSVLPSGAIILQAECLPTGSSLASMYRGRQPPLSHLAAAGGLDDTRFIASSWAIPGQQPIAVQPAYQRYYDLLGSVGGDCLTDAAGASALVTQVRGVAQADASASPVFLLLLRQNPEIRLPSPATAVTGSRGYFDLYRVW